MPLQADEIRVAAAANLRYVLPELAKVFEQGTSHKLAISYAASGTLTTQIQHGAPFDVFLSADPYYIQRLRKLDLTVGEPVNYAKAQLALFASHHSSLNIEEGLLSLKIALEQGKLNKIAIANPRHAPYGQAAKRELENLGIWQEIQPHLLIAENASQAVQFALSSTVDAGLVPYGHIIQPKLASQGVFIKLDATLQQQGIIIQGASDNAMQLMKFIQQKEAKTIFSEYGFL
ncbi:MAG: molybdate ABC transporter substrate-binding protein [Methylophaga sp.]|nr:molybdate ABC transporter substrate-binding protein [Methylophaga sp.]